MAQSTLAQPKHADAASHHARAWQIVALLWFVALLNYLDRLTITAMRDPIRLGLHVNDAQFGMLTAVFLWVYASLSPLGGFVADRIGRSVVIICSLLFWSAATWASGFSHTFHQLLAARALMGVSEAFYVPAALALIADYHPGRTRSLATGIHMSGIYAGAALGGIGGYLAAAFGWRSAFRIFGGIGVCYCVVLILMLRDLPRPNTAASAPQEPPPEAPSLGTALRLLFSSTAFWMLFTIDFLVGVVNWSVYGWMPTFLRQQFNLGLGAAGMSATGYIQIASFAGVLIAGAWADRWRRTNNRARALVPAFGWLLAAPFLFAAASTPVLLTAIIGLIVYGLGRGAFDANLMPLVREVIDERLSATTYGLLNFIGSAAGGIMVYVGGAMLDAHVALSRIFQFSGMCLLVIGLMLIALRVRNHQASQVTD